MHDIVVLSDLHVGRGRNPDTGRFHKLETFFYDEDLRRFLRWAADDAHARGTTVRLVFNGDTFDFLRTEVPPDGDATRRQQRFGADLTPPVAAQLVRDILAGHPVFVEALADLLARGSDIVVLPGNHDRELQWTPVQDELREALRRSLASRRADVDEALGRLSFHPWFVHEEGRIWIEHGCQYDPENAYRYPLRTRLSSREVDPNVLEVDLPLGNFFQRYLYNAFGPLTFIVPSTRANARYTRWFLLHEPRLLFRVVWSHLPFIFQAIRRIAQKQSPDRALLEGAHEAELAELARSSGLGERLARIDRLKRVSGDVAQAAKEYGLQALRFTSIASAFAFCGIGLWSSGFYAINELHAGFGPKALLFLMLNLVMIAAAGVALAYSLVRDSPPPSPWPMRTAAQEIVKLLDVPVVTFGHTHEEVIWRLDRGAQKAWYFNTGTWVAVFVHDVFIPRERVQLTFLRMKNHDAELLHWSPGRGEPLPVVLLDELQYDVPVAPVTAAG